MADLKLVIQEDITLDDNNRSTKFTKTLEGVSYVDHRTMNAISGSETEIFALSNNPGAGTFVTSSLIYARVSNLSSTYPVNLKISSSTEDMNYSIEAGGSFMLSTSKMTGSLEEFNYDDVFSLKVEPSSSNAKIEYFVATS
jgi:hypothetical protein